MHYMRGPKPIYIMRCPVKPVVRKIISEEKQNPIPPFTRIQIKNPERIQEHEEAKDDCFGNKAYNNISDA